MKLTSLYDADNVVRLADSANSAGFKDSDGGVILARQLTAVNPKIFEKKYPELALFSTGIQSDNTGGEALRIQSLRMSDIGEFATVGDKSDNKGKISISAEDSYLQVFPREAFSEWSQSDIGRADLGGINLVSRFLMAHNKVYLREIDVAGFIGLAGNTGLLNNASATSTASSVAMSTLTGLEAYAEIANLITGQRAAVNETPEYSANTVVMPIAVYEHLAKTHLDTSGSADTVLTALKRNFPGVAFVATFRANGTTGSSGTSVTAAFNSGEDVMVMRIPVPLTVSEIVQTSGFKFRVDSRYNVAGLDVLETAGIRYRTGL